MWISLRFSKYLHYFVKRIKNLNLRVWNPFVLSGSQDSSAGLVTRLQTERSRARGSILGRDKRYFSFPQHPYMLCTRSAKRLKCFIAVEQWLVMLIFADQVGSNSKAPKFYSGGALLYFRPGYRLSGLRLSVVIFSHSRQIPWLYFQLIHDRFLPILTNSLFTYPTIRRYIVWTPLNKL
jgi:hypothetical protein